MSTLNSRLKMQPLSKLDTNNGLVSGNNLPKKSNSHRPKLGPNHTANPTKGVSRNRRTKKRKKTKGMSNQRPFSNVNLNAEPKGHPKITRKVYRKTKVLRIWVLPTLFLVPLGMMMLEYYIGKLIDLEDIRDVYQEQLVDPWALLLQDVNASSIQQMYRNPIPTSFLANVSYTPREKCPPGQRRMINVHNPSSHHVEAGRRLIPNIIHQQSKTRCLTMKIDKATTKWAFRRWSYYIHDESSRSRLLERYCGGRIPKCEFPLLRQVMSGCLNNRNSRNHLRYYYLKVELWKFLTLWIFGGVYVDLNFLPMKFSPTVIKRYDDGFLLFDLDTQMLSTKLMAVSPRHPIMYYAVQRMLLSILMEESLSLSPVGTTAFAQNDATSHAEYESGICGSTILSQAFRMFQDGHNVEGEKLFAPGTFHGVMNRTLRVVASSGLNTKLDTDENDREDTVDPRNINLVGPIFGSEIEKEDEYQRMGVIEDMKEVDESSEGENGATRSCLYEMYHQLHKGYFTK